MIQLYARIEDLIPGENKTSGHWNTKWDYFLPEDEPYKGWFADILHDGIKYQLQVEPAGHIRDGNFRYYMCQRHLMNTRFLPVDPFYFFGLAIIPGHDHVLKNTKTGHYHSTHRYTLRQAIYDILPHHKYLANKHAIQPGNIKMAELETLTTIPLEDLIKP